MADLITNLQSIYNTKLQIKEAIGTDSDIFADYPAYISAMGDEGYTYITMNGDHSVNGYAYVNVNVPGATEYDHIDISTNSQVDVSAYNYAYVSVPVPPGYIIPEGTINIDTVGTHDVTAYASAYVDIQVPTYVFGYQTITNNGVAYASSYGLDGFTYVDVQVPQSGGSSHSGTSAIDAWTVDEAISYISAFEDTNEHLYTELGFIPYVEGVIAAVRNTRSAQYPSARYTITRTGESPAADFSNAIICWNINPAAGQQSWTEGVDRQVKVGDHVILAADKLQKYYDSNNDVYQMEFKNGWEIQGQSEVANTLNISQSGTYDVQSYVSAYVNVSGGSQYPEITIQSLPYTMQNFVLDANLGTTVYLYDGLLSTMDNGLSQLPYGTYVSGILTPVFSDNYVNQVAGSQLYVEKTEAGSGTSYITVDSGITYPWQNTNVVINSAEFSSQDAGLSGGLTNKMWFITDPVSMVSYPISSYDYNTWRAYDGGNIIINYDADTTWGFPMPITACIVGVDNS